MLTGGTDMGQLAVQIGDAFLAGPGCRSSVFRQAGRFGQLGSGLP